MSIFIDLLPIERRNELKKKKTIRSVIFQETFLSFILIIFLGSLFSIWYILKIQSDSLDSYMQHQSSQSQNQELARYEERFRMINEEVRSISKIQSSHLKWTNLLALLEQAVPGGVILDRITTESYKVSISGKADQRDNLLAFENSLSQSGCLREINAPLSNLVSKENIVFQIDFIISEECLKK